jgi:hypothetical protein
MPLTTVGELIPVLQVAIGPVILISGVGLLLLTMTNRYGRVIDRSRLLVRESGGMADPAREQLVAQLGILMRRAELIRLAILLAGVSVLLAATLVIVLFLTALLGLEVAWLITLLFSGCMLALIGSLVAFIVDVNQSLAAVRLEVEKEMGKGIEGLGMRNEE